MAFTEITVSFKYQNMDLSAAAGSVSFSRTTEITDGTTILPVVPIMVTLDGTGSGSVVLAANDDSTTTPTGSGYMVTERIVGAPVRTYKITLTHTTPGGAINLASFI